MTLTNLLIGFFALYVFFKIYLEIREVIFIKNEFPKGPILLDLNEFKEAALYAINIHSINILENLISLFLVVFYFSGGLFILNFLLYSSTSTLSQLEIIIAFFTINYILTLPIKIWRIYIDKKFSFNNSYIKLIIIDEIKKIFLFLIFGSIFFYFLIKIIEATNYWWIYASLFSIFSIILINILFPIFASLFNKFTPLEDVELQEEIKILAKKAGFKIEKIFVVNASKRDSRLNAYFAGLGKNKRVVLFDTLLNKLNKKEILAVLAHELGHFKNKDILKNIAIVSFMIITIFAIFGHIPKEIFKELHIPYIPANIIILILLFFEPIMFILTPLFNYISRKNEFNADKFSKELTSKEDLKSALKKLVKENKHFPKVTKLYAFIYYSHPQILERLKKLDED